MPMPTSAPRTVIDVRLIAPPKRRRTIFAAFRALKAGDCLDIVNDHDLSPLRQQFEYEAPRGFT